MRCSNSDSKNKGVGVKVSESGARVGVRNGDSSGGSE